LLSAGDKQISWTCRNEPCPAHGVLTIPRDRSKVTELQMQGPSRAENVPKVAQFLANRVSIRGGRCILIWALISKSQADRNRAGERDCWSRQAQLPGGFSRLEALGVESFIQARVGDSCLRPQHVSREPLTESRKQQPNDLFVLATAS